MANRNRTKNAYRYKYQMPVSGSEALQPVIVPRREKREHVRRREEVKAPKKVSAQVRANRNRAQAMNRGFVIFLLLTSILSVAMCIHYLKLRSTLTSQIEANSKLESQLTTLKSENDALYENVTNNVDLNYIRDYAINNLGMKYATEDQVIWYNTEGSEYVRQYQDVPSGK